MSNQEKQAQMNEKQKLLEASIAELLNLFVGNASSSDLHLRTNARPRFRTNSDVKEIGELGVSSPDFMQYLVLKIFVEKYGSKEGRAMFDDFIYRGHEEDLAIDLPNSDYRARLNIAKSLGDIKITFRKIPNDMPLIESLGFKEEHLRQVRTYMGYKEGLVLVTGQTGSGKSTTLASIINEINHNKSRHIVTIENPVEFRHNDVKSLITHREVGSKSDTKSFADGIRAAMRQDPDIILVGEIRDSETATAALQAAQTGHLVFGTLHTNSAAETLTRFLDMFPPESADSIRVSLGTSLRLILSQKLVPTIDNRRVLAYECMYTNNNIKNAIITDPKGFANTIKEQMNNNFKHGMIDINRCLVSLYQANIIDLDMVYEYASDRDEVKGLIQV